MEVLVVRRALVRLVFLNAFEQHQAVCQSSDHNFFFFFVLVSTRINLPVSLFGIPRPVSSQRLLMGWICLLPAHQLFRLCESHVRWAGLCSVHLAPQRWVFSDCNCWALFLLSFFLKGYKCRTAKEVKPAVKSAAMGNLYLTTKQRSFHSINGLSRILKGFDSDDVLNKGWWPQVYIIIKSELYLVDTG